MKSQIIAHDRRFPNRRRLGRKLCQKFIFQRCGDSYFFTNKSAFMTNLRPIKAHFDCRLANFPERAISLATWSLIELRESVFTLISTNLLLFGEWNRVVTSRECVFHLRKQLKSIDWELLAGTSFFVKNKRWTHLLRAQTVAADVDGAVPVVGRGYLAGVELVMRKLLSGRRVRTSVCVVVVGQS